jgi:hypothetical protein
MFQMHGFTTWSCQFTCSNRTQLGYYTENTSYQSYMECTSACISILPTWTTGASASEMHCKHRGSKSEKKPHPFNLPTRTECGKGNICTERSKRSFQAYLLMQYLFPVGGGPSSKTCPRWASQTAHRDSVRGMKKIDMSSLLLTLSPTGW